MKFKLFIFALFALLVAGCSLEPLPQPEKEEGKIVTINISISAETRVAYEDSATPGSGGTLKWEIGDKLLLAGYDAYGNYTGHSSIFTWSGNGNIFTGSDIGAAKYKAYYPGDVITLDASGNVQLPADFWQQAQTGNNTTTHLRNKLLLFDEDANPLNQVFTLALKSSIIRFNLSNIPTSVGALQKLVWTLETATGVFKSMTLNVNNVTFSAGNTDLTAFLSFDPTVMKIAAGGKVRIVLHGAWQYLWRTTVTSEKNYTAGNRYKGNVSSGWTANPLLYVADYNVNTEGNGFVTDLTSCENSGYFTYSDAVSRFKSGNTNIPGYYLPNASEWRGIVPAYVSGVGYFVRFTETWSYDNNDEQVNVQSKVINMTSDYRTTTNGISYALRYKGTDLVSAWRYEYTGYNTMNCHMKITSRDVASSVTIAEIAQESFWNSNNAHDVIRYIPASGSASGNKGKNGYYWSSTKPSSSANYMNFNKETASTSTGGSTSSFPARLFVSYSYL